MILLPLTLFLLSLGPQHNGVFAAQGNESCSTSNQRLQLGTYKFSSDCDAMWFCNSSSLCDWKRCRKDEYPFGYWENVTVPDRCQKGSFCPDEGDACQPLLAVDSPCQFNRDDQCEAPPDWRDLADHKGFGLNVNGSVCLNNVCMWANATLGSECIVENTPYIIYTPTSEFAEIVSRDNCRLGLYCDASAKQCMKRKDHGTKCAADKECTSFNCGTKGVCDYAADTPTRVGAWVYAIVGIAIFGGMASTLTGMFFLHRKQREQENQKRIQYWREQNAFRQNILQMQETARDSLMSLAVEQGQRNSLYINHVGSDESQLPLAGAARPSSGLRHYISDDGSDEGVMMRGGRQQHRF